MRIFVRRDPDGVRGKPHWLCHEQLLACSDGTAEAFCRCCLQEALLTATPCAIAVLARYPSQYWHAGPALRFLVALAKKKFGIDPLHKVRRVWIRFRHHASKILIGEQLAARQSLVFAGGGQVSCYLQVLLAVSICLSLQPLPVTS